MAKGRTKKIYTSIKDELLNPYFIKVDDDNFTVVNESNEDNGLYFCTTLSSALNRIAKMKVNSKGDTKSLKEYMNEYNEMLNQFKESIVV